MSKWILLIGNPIEGMVCTGPFDDSEEAIKAGDTVRNQSWWVMEVTPHDEDNLPLTAGDMLRFPKR